VVNVILLSTQAAELAALSNSVYYVLRTEEEKERDPSVDIPEQSVRHPTIGSFIVAIVVNVRRGIQR
jgi:hypothetical protein